MPEKARDFRELKRIADATATAARAAGAVILEMRESGRADVSRKSDHSPVTAADLAAHELLVRSLAEILPGVPLLSEEDPEGFTIPASGPFWVIDPLDGTEEFIRGGDQFCVNVALREGASSLLGVVHVPAAEAGFVGVPSHGAWCVSASGAEKPLPGPLRARPGEQLTVFVSRWHMSRKVEAMRAALPPHVSEVRGAALKFTALAAGEGHVALGGGGTKIWDTAAGEALLLASGGFLSGPGGHALAAEPPVWKNPHWMASGDPALFPAP